MSNPSSMTKEEYKAYSRSMFNTYYRNKKKNNNNNKSKAKNINDSRIPNNDNALNMTDNNNKNNSQQSENNYNISTKKYAHSSMKNNPIIANATVNTHIDTCTPTNTIIDTNIDVNVKTNNDNNIRMQPHTNTISEKKIFKLKLNVKNYSFEALLKLIIKCYKNYKITIVNKKLIDLSDDDKFLKNLYNRKITILNGINYRFNEQNYITFKNKLISQLDASVSKMINKNINITDNYNIINVTNESIDNDNNDDINNKIKDNPNTKEAMCQLYDNFNEYMNDKNKMNDQVRDIFNHLYLMVKKDLRNKLYFFYDTYANELKNDVLDIEQSKYMLKLSNINFREIYVTESFSNTEARIKIYNFIKNDLS